MGLFWNTISNLKWYHNIIILALMFVVRVGYLYELRLSNWGLCLILDGNTGCLSKLRKKRVWPTPIRKCTHPSIKVSKNLLQLWCKNKVYLLNYLFSTDYYFDIYMTLIINSFDIVYWLQWLNTCFKKKNNDIHFDWVYSWAFASACTTYVHSQESSLNNMIAR